MKYQVRLYKTVTYETHLLVTADDEGDAEDKALVRAEGKGSREIDWELDDEGIEVTDVEECVDE